MDTVWALKSSVPAETVVVPLCVEFVRTHLPAPDLETFPPPESEAERVFEPVDDPARAIVVPAKPVRAV
jgi:hypothetical protein